MAALYLFLLLSFTTSRAEDFCFPESERVPMREDFPTIRVAQQSWGSTVLNAFVLKILMHEKLGIRTETPFVSTTDMWDLVENQTINIIAEIWSGSRYDAYLEYVVRRGTVVSAGPLGVTGRIGWHATGGVLKSLHGDMNGADYWRTYKKQETADMYNSPNVSANKGMYVNGARDWANMDQQLIDNLELPFEIVWAGSGSKMLQMLDEHVDDLRPMLFYWWTPHEVFFKHDLVRVSFPEPTSACLAKISTGGVDCDYAPDFLIKVHSTDLPTPLRFLLRSFRLDNADHIEMLAKTSYFGFTPFEAACEWVKERWEHKLSPWIPPGSAFCVGNEVYDEEAKECIEPTVTVTCGDGEVWSDDQDKCVNPPGFWNSGRLAALVVPLALVVVGLLTAAAIFFRRWTVARRNAEKEKNQRELSEARRDKEVAEISDANKRKTLRYLMHEIRVPFHVVTVGVDTLLREPEQLDHHQVDVLSTVQVSSRMVMSLLDDVLDLQKIEDGKFELHTQRIDICRLLRKGQESFALLASEKGIEIRVETPPVITVIGDELRLTQTISNFVSNAIKFTHSGGRITLSARVGEEEQLGGLGVRVSVLDSGVGISPEHLKKLFEAWSQVNAMELQKGKGSGLGLSLAKSLVEKHGGFVSVHSDKGVGSEFSFTIPAPHDWTEPCPIPDHTRPSFCAVYKGVDSTPSTVQRISTTETLPSNASVTDNGHGNGGPRATLSPKAPRLAPLLRGRYGISTILVVDDVETVLKIMKHALHREGFENILTASDGEQAVTLVKARSRDIDLVLLDKEMPVMDGFVAARQIKAIAPWLPIIGVTGNALQVDVEAFIDHGADGVLTKPIKLPDLAVHPPPYTIPPSMLPSITPHHNPTLSHSTLPLYGRNSLSPPTSLRCVRVSSDAQGMLAEVITVLTTSGQRVAANLKPEPDDVGEEEGEEEEVEMVVSSEDIIVVEETALAEVARLPPSLPTLDDDDPEVQHRLAASTATPTAQAPPPVPRATPAATWTPSVTDCKASVLLVDDLVLGVKLLTRALMKQGYWVESAMTGDDALSLATQRADEGTPFDVAFVDYNMPGLSGPETVTRLLRVSSTTVCCGLSGCAEDDRAHEFRQAGAAKYLVKPATPAQLIDFIQGSKAPGGQLRNYLVSDGN